MTDRYFSAEPIRDSLHTLTGDEAHHLRRVMRVQFGQEVLLFDGSGAEFQARVEEVGRAEVRLAILARNDIDREIGFSLVAGVALPKGDRQRWLVEKLVETGATQLVPLTTRRGVAQPNSKALARLERAVIEASKQCGRNRLMEIGSPQSVEDFVAAHPSGILADPTGAPFADFARDGLTGDVAFAVGPEGGFDETELAVFANSRWQRVSLGQRILRIETAALWLVTAITVSHA